jgi:hypothetical protein
MEPLWLIVWRKGLLPQFSDSHLRRLLEALERDDPRLLQGATTCPPPLMAVQDWPCEGGCALALPLVEVWGVDTVGEIEEKWARLAYQCGQLVGEEAAVRHFLNHFDSVPREQLRRELAEEVRRALAEVQE